MSKEHRSKRCLCTWLNITNTLSRQHFCARALGWHQRGMREGQKHVMKPPPRSAMCLYVYTGPPKNNCEMLSIFPGSWKLVYA